MKSGIVAALVAYTLWGILPVFWKAVESVPTLEVLSQRAVWSLIVALLIVTAKKHWGWIQQVKSKPRTLLIFLGTASLLSLNWYTYIWAVDTGHVVDSSLGYFINPLVSVLLGVLFLRERLRLWQGVAIGLASVGVLIFALGFGAFPWIALTLALTFGFYGLVRKTAPLGSLEGLCLETAWMSVPALAYLLYLTLHGAGSFGHVETSTSVLLALTGVVTAVPLLAFGYAARRVTLSTVGILQYIAPTLQFLLGVFAYHEPFTEMRLLGFAVIWLALLVYSAEGVMVERRRRARMFSVG